MKESEGHQGILERLIFEKKTSKRELAKNIGKSPTNSTTLFNKATYTKKMIEKISTVLGVEPSVFYVHAPIIQTGDGNTATITIGERALYERLLKEKDNRIADLERQLGDKK